MRASVGPTARSARTAVPLNVLRMEGEAHRAGLHNCRDCRKQFSVTVGTVFERSHVPLHKWVLANYLMNSSKKGISAHQLHRTIGVTYKTAWFMAHRLREAMTDTNLPPIGGEGKVVEADEMYHGKAETKAPLSRGRIARPTKKGRSGPAEKRAVIALVERGGEARAEAMTGKAVTAKNVGEVLRRHADKASRLQTDESRIYPPIAGHFASHETVQHCGRRVCSRQGRGPCDHEQRRRLLRRVQAWIHRHLPALRGAALPALPRRIHLPL